MVTRVDDLEAPGVLVSSLGSLWSAQGLGSCISSDLGILSPASGLQGTGEILGPSDARPYVSLLPGLCTSFISCPVLVKRHTSLPILMVCFG